MLECIASANSKVLISFLALDSFTMEAVGLAGHESWKLQHPNFHTLFGCLLLAAFAEGIFEQGLGDYASV